MRIALRSLILIAVIAMLAACGSQQHSADTSTVLATVNGVPITNDMFRAYVRSLAGGQEPQLDAQRRQLVLNHLIDMEVLAQEARKTGLEKQATVAADLKILNTSLLANQLVQQYLSQHQVTENQVKAAYDAMIKTVPSTQYRARHILVATQQQAEDIIKQLNHGANFAALAKKYSTDSTAAQGGQLPWFSPSDMVPAFSAAVAQLKKGEYTQQPVHTQFGWHVIQLEDTRSVPPPSLDSSREQLTNNLQGQEIEAYVNTLRQGAKVVINTGSAPAPAATPAPAGGTKPASNP